MSKSTLIQKTDGAKDAIARARLIKDKKAITNAMTVGRFNVIGMMQGFLSEKVRSG